MLTSPTVIKNKFSVTHIAAIWYEADEPPVDIGSVNIVSATKITNPNWKTKRSPRITNKPIIMLYLRTLRSLWS